MKVTGAAGSTPTSGPRATRGGGGGFSISQPGSAGSMGAASAVSGPSGLAGVSALMALQGVEDPTERRRRAVRRGAGLLDRLDALRSDLLSGQAPAESLRALSTAISEMRPSDDDDGLKAVLDQIDLRAAVELAKAELGRSAA